MMFADAAREVRHHPGRIVATLVAIAISVAFMAGVSIFMATQAQSLGRSLALTTSKADVVATIATPKQGVTDKQLRSALLGVDGVEAAEPSAAGMAALSTDKGTVYASLYATPDERFRWAELESGSWPAKPTEVALSRQLADKLGVGVGQQVSAGDTDLTVSGISDDAPSMFFQTAYTAPAGLAGPATAGQGTSTNWLLGTAAGSDRDQTITAVREALRPLVDDPDTVPEYSSVPNLDVTSGEQAQAQSVQDVTGGFDAMKYALLVFSGIAALVGLITIANTFTILLAQRRRQIGLLRAVGATGAQVRRRFLAEAVLLGILGSALGLVLGGLIAWVGAAYTRATYWGMSFPVRDLAVEFGIGVLLTVLAAMLPALKATRVAPLEALQPVATSEQVRRASVVRAVVCALFVVAGALLCWRSLTVAVGEGASSAAGPVASAVGGALLLTVGVLFAAPLYVPWLLRGLGALFGFLGPSARLAASNAARNPRRASATATALMLACGLIVTLQVGSATAERTVLKEIDARYPVDVQVFSYGNPMAEGASQDRTLPAKVTRQLATLPNVAAGSVMSGGQATLADGQEVTLVGIDQDATRAARDLPMPTASQALTTTQHRRGETLALRGANGVRVTLTAVPGQAAPDSSVLLVDPSVVRQLVASPTPQLYWGRVADRDDMGSTMAPLERLQQAHPGLMVSGSVAESYMISKILDLLLAVTSALLGVAVLIALVGVGNTLGLSVIERTRESALLRALGMQRAGLRAMLLVEALMLALAGVLVGVAAGGFFGWLGVKALLRQAEMDSRILFGINWPMTLGLVAVAVLAAALASVLPGRRAASATPTEALAQD